MVERLARDWWVLALRGVLAILFGVAALIFPGAAVEALVLLFGAFMLVNGIFALLAAFRARGGGGNTPWWAFLLEGILGVVVGILVLAVPGIVALAGIFFIAAWAIVTGVFEIIAAIRLRQEIQGEVWMILAGIASVVFGVLAILFPLAGLLALAWLAGVYAIVFGVMFLALAFRLKGHADRAPATGTA